MEHVINQLVEMYYTYPTAMKTDCYIIHVSSCVALHARWFCKKRKTFLVLQKLLTNSWIMHAKNTISSTVISNLKNVLMPNTIYVETSTCNIWVRMQVHSILNIHGSNLQQLFKISNEFWNLFSTKNVKQSIQLYYWTQKNYISKIW